MLGKDHLDSWFFLATFSCVAHSKHSVKMMYSKLTAWSVCIYIYLYNNVTSVCIFIGCWPWSIKGYTHRWCQIHVISRQQTCFSFFMPQKSFNKPFEFLLYKTNELNFSMCVYCNRSQKMSQRVKNNSHTTRLRLVTYFFVLYTHDVICDLLQYTHREKCNLFANYICVFVCIYIYST